MSETPMGHTENAPRDCGGCNVCCTAMHVRALNKPVGQVCEFQTASGCGNYHDRPAACRQWFCMWVRDTGRVFTDADRPDRLGAFFTASEPDPATGRPTIYVHPIREGAIDEPRLAELIALFEQAAEVQVLDVPQPVDPLTHLTIRGRRDVA